MKKLVTIVAIFSAFSAFAGRTSMTKTISVSSTLSEAAMVLKAEALIPGIVNFTNEDIKREARYEGCSTRARDIKLGSVSVKKFYKSNDNSTLEPMWYGSISYTLKNCRDND